MKVRIDYTTRAVTILEEQKVFQYSHNVDNIEVIIDYYNPDMLYKFNFVDGSGTANLSRNATYLGTIGDDSYFRIPLNRNNTTYGNANLKISFSIVEPNYENDPITYKSVFISEQFEQFIEESNQDSSIDIEDETGTIVDDIYADIARKLNVTAKGYYYSSDFELSGDYTTQNYINAVYDVLSDSVGEYIFDGFAEIINNSVTLTDSPTDVSETVLKMAFRNSSNVSQNVSMIIGRDQNSTDLYYGTHDNTTFNGWDKYGNEKSIDILEDNAKYNLVTQSGSEFYRTAEDSTLYEGRPELVDISSIITGTGLITYSLDGNVTKRPVVGTDGTQLDLSTITARGIYILGVYDGTNWVIIHASDDFSLLLQKTIDNATGITALNGAINDLIAVVSAGGQVITQITELTIPITLTGTNQKITFDTLQKGSNDIAIIDVDGNGDHILKSDNTAGYNNLGNFTFTSTAGFFTTSVCVLDLYLDGVLQDSLEISAGFNESNNKVKQCDCILSTTPQTLTVEARVTAGSGTLDSGTLRVASNWTTTGGVPGPSTTLVTTLSSPATETPSGTKTKQQEANEEFTSVLEETNKLQNGLYVSSGQFKIDSNNPLATTNIYSILFGENTDESNAQFSVDNGSNYYDIVYLNKKTGNKLNVQANELSGTIATIYFDGTDFVMITESSVLTDQLTFNKIIDSTYGQTNPIKGISRFIEADSVSLEQVVSNGDFADGTTDWSGAGIDGGNFVVVNEILQFKFSVGYGYVNQILASSSNVGDKYYFIAKVKATSSNISLRMTDSGTPLGITNHSGSGEFEIISGVATIQNGGELRFRVQDNRTSGWDLIYMDYAMVFNITNTPLASESAETIANRLTGLYWEGRKDTVNPRWDTKGTNLFDKTQYTDVDFAYKIEVKPSTQYTWAESIAYKIYDANETELSSGTASTVTTDSNAYYIAFANTIADVDTFRLNEGDTLLPYEEFNEGYLELIGTGYSVGTSQDKFIETETGYAIQRYTGTDNVTGIVAFYTTNYPLAKDGGVFTNYLTAGGSESGVIGTDSTSGDGFLIYELASASDLEDIEYNGTPIQDTITTIIQSNDNVAIDTTFEFSVDESALTLTTADKTRKNRKDIDDVEVKVTNFEGDLAKKPYEIVASGTLTDPTLNEIIVDPQDYGSGQYQFICYDFSSSTSLKIRASSSPDRSELKGSGYTTASTADITIDSDARSTVSNTKHLPVQIISDINYTYLSQDVIRFDTIDLASRIMQRNDTSGNTEIRVDEAYSGTVKWKLIKL